MATTAQDEDRATSTIVQTLDIIGDRWSLLILRSAFRGVRRFSEIQRDLDIAKNLLADRLSRLVDNDILEKVQYQERPPRYEYHLTEKGLELSPALVAFMHWGDRWCAGGEAPTTLVHDACGTALEHVVRCPSCETEVDPTHIRSRENS